MRAHSTIKAVGLIILLAVLGGCTSQNALWLEVGTLDGNLIVVNSEPTGYPEQARISIDDGKTWPAEFVDSEDIERASMSTLKELCLSDQPQVCIRMTGETIEESTDGGQTFATVWGVDLSGFWLGRQNEAEEPLVIETGTLLETPDGAVLVTVGAIPPIRRSSDGTWSPNEAGLRKFPASEILLILAGVLATAIPTVMRPARVSLAIAGFCLLLIGLTIIEREPTNEMVPLYPLFASGLGLILICFLVAAIIGEIRRRRSSSTAPKGDTARFSSFAPWLLAVVAPGAAYGAFSVDLISWPTATSAWLGCFTVSFIGSRLSTRLRDTARMLA